MFRMRFQEFERPNGEIYWQTSIPRTPYSIQVRSGMLADNTYTPAPDLGIRIYLIDTISLAPVAPVIRIRRTQHSLRNISEKVGYLWKEAISMNSGKARHK